MFYNHMDNMYLIEAVLYETTLIAIRSESNISISQVCHGKPEQQTPKDISSYRTACSCQVKEFVQIYDAELG